MINYLKTPVLFANITEILLAHVIKRNENEKIMRA